MNIKTSVEKNKLFMWLIYLTAISGLLHLLIVSVTHRENFVELWYFTLVGLLQVLLAWYSKRHSENFGTNTFLAIVLNGGLVVTWLATRIWNAPFASYPEAVGFVDTFLAAIEFAAVVFGLVLLNKKSATTKILVVVSLVAVVFGSVNYLGAKGSELVFRGVPISDSPHRHSIAAVFKAPVLQAPVLQDSVIKDSVEIFNVMGINMTEEQAREHCSVMAMQQMEVCQQFSKTVEMKKPEINTPMVHDNSDGHHN